MRRLRLALYAAVTILSLAPAGASLAQYGHQGGGGGGDDQQKEEEARKKRSQAFGLGPQVKLRNAGPCPYVKVLYDAARYVEFKDNVEASAAVGYSGEIENISSACAYAGAEPIRVDMQILFELGRGPQATAGRKTYRYWIAVTDRNNAVLDKEWFDLPVSFPAGQDRTTAIETLKGITIPRANGKVSGNNFEILTGFEVTPQMADFNRQGKRFKANVGQSAPPTQVSSARP
ncbi:MAG TPA: Tat pathway signal sequence domain protein [Caulobacteraceae bacterium]|jgi:hypothetical protein|nr:Tat pathway signal sequence domain protein [Caulobacteraceae bacterium]